MPTLTVEQLHERLAARFPGVVGPLTPPARDAFFTLPAAQLLEVCQFLKTEPSFAFDFLQDLSATDHPKDGLIRLVYHFYSYTHRHLLTLKVELERRAPQAPTLEGLWKAANWMEREVFDLFGVTFTGHPDLRRVLLPDDWVGHPLRKDYSEAGGYRGISNLRDNPLDQYLAMDRQRKAEQPPEAAPKVEG